MTPIEELIEQLRIEKVLKEDDLSEIMINQLVAIYKLKEKEVIIEVWNSANEDGICCVDSSAEQYYKETFNK